MTFTVLDEHGRCPMPDKKAALLASYQWTAWAQRCATIRGILGRTHRRVYDDVNRTITVECAGMTSAYTYPAPN